MGTLKDTTSNESLWEEPNCYIDSVTESAAYIDITGEGDFEWFPKSLIKNDPDEIEAGLVVDLIIPMWKARQLGLV